MLDAKHELLPQSEVQLSGREVILPFHRFRRVFSPYVSTEGWKRRLADRTIPQPHVVPESPRIPARMRAFGRYAALLARMARAQNTAVEKQDCSR